MTKDDVIRLAREAGFKASVGKTDRDGKYHPNINALSKDVPVEWLERFAALVMEEDAKVCDALKDDETQFNAAVEKQLKGNDEARQLHALRMLSNVQLYNAGFIKSAAAIRARKPA